MMSPHLLEERWAAPRRHDAHDLATEILALVDELRRNDTVLQAALLAVEIQQQSVQQSRALDHAAFDRAPFSGIDQQREQIEPPGPRVIAVALGHERNAVFAEQSLRLVVRRTRRLAARSRREHSNRCRCAHATVERLRTVGLAHQRF